MGHTGRWRDKDTISTGLLISLSSQLYHHVIDLGLAFTSALLLLDFDIKHASKLVTYKLPCFFVSCEHKVMDIAPLLAVINIFEVGI